MYRDPLHCTSSGMNGTPINCKLWKVNYCCSVVLQFHSSWIEFVFVVQIIFRFKKTVFSLHVDIVAEIIKIVGLNFQIYKIIDERRTFKLLCSFTKFRSWLCSSYPFHLFVTSDRHKFSKTPDGRFGICIPMGLNEGTVYARPFRRQDLLSALNIREGIFWICH